jgi:hypothetical protein
MRLQKKDAIPSECCSCTRRPKGEILQVHRCSYLKPQDQRNSDEALAVVALCLLWSAIIFLHVSPSYYAPNSFRYKMEEELLLQERPAPSLHMTSKVGQAKTV